MSMMLALVGMKHRGTEDLVRSLPCGEPVTLVREWLNDFDPRAIQVWAHGKHVGYIAAKQNQNLASVMDKHGKPASGPEFSEGYSLVAKLMIREDRWAMIEVESEGLT